MPAQTATRPHTAADVAFRVLRQRVLELGAIAQALSASAEPTRMWRRIAISAQALLNVDGCTYYRVDGNWLKPAIVISKRLGLIMGAVDESHVDFPPIAIRDAEGQVDETCLAARAVVTSRIVTINDMMAWRSYAGSRTQEFDRKTGYRTCAVMSVPVRANTGGIIGVLQVVNPSNSRGEAVDFDAEHEDLATTLASLISISQRL